MKIILLFFLCILSFFSFSQSVRNPVDPVGFATQAWQMDSIIARIHQDNSATSSTLRLAICPHDDYAYAGSLYEKVLPGIKAKTVIILGVAHKAKKFRVEQKLVFDSYKEWKEPYGNVNISSLREEIMKNLPSEDYIIHDSLQGAEHSVEALVPFLQYHNRNVEIISILVPYMDFPMINKYAKDLAASISKVMKKNRLEWGKDLAIVVSNDAVHYGDEDWGGQNYATYGCDSAGYEKAVAHEKEILKNTILPAPDTVGVHKFFNYTVQSADWHTYKWPWCGRYSIPMGLLTGMYLGQMTGKELTAGIFFGYETSISHPSLKVEDLGMGKTAIANLHHWVGYAAVGYK